MRGLDQDPIPRASRCNGTQQELEQVGRKRRPPYKSLVLISFLSAEANAIPPRPMHSDGRPISGRPSPSRDKHERAQLRHVRKKRSNNTDLAGDWRRLDERIEGLSTDITSLVEQDPACARLMTVPGIGPIISSASARPSFVLSSQRNRLTLKATSLAPIASRTT